MNEQLTDFIQLCLTDGTISEKEKKVIYKKAKEFGVDKDECEILIDSYTFQANKTSKTNESFTSKPVRKFVLKKVNTIPPAQLNQEKELYKKIDILTEEEKKITIDYNKFLNKLSSINDNIKPIKASLKVEFENLKKEVDNGTKNLNKNYINNINQEVLRKFGKTEMILSKSEKISLSNLTPNKKKDYILKNVKWNSADLLRKLRKRRNFWFVMTALVCVSSSFIWNIYVMILGCVCFGIGYFKNEKIKKNTMNFTNDDIELIIDEVNKSLKNTYEQLELKKKMIKNYSALFNYDWTLPPKK